jgi:hypothetical protein
LFQEKKEKCKYWNLRWEKSYNKKIRKGGRMKKTVLYMVLFSIFLLSSCFYIRVDYPLERGRAPIEDYQNNVPLNPGGTLSLENLNGNVEIHGWEQEELAVYAEKTIQLPDNPRLYVFPKGNFAPGIIFDKFENFVKIRTKDFPENRGMGYVDYYIDVPHSINLKDILVGTGNITITEVYGEAYMDLADGDIIVENFSGSLSASVDRGSVSANLFDLREEDEIVILSREGNITLGLQEGASAQIEAVFPEGAISSDFEFDTPLETKKIDIQLGKGGPRVFLTALKGDIRVNKITRE